MTSEIPPNHRDSYHTRRDFQFGYLNQSWQKYQGSFTNWSRRGMKPPVLDMGAGIGLLTECFLRNQCQTVGLEASLDGAQMAVERIPSMPMVCSILRAGLHFPFRERAFNTILFNQCVTQFTRETTRYCIVESNRILPIGGLLIISTTTSYFDDIYRGHNINAYTPEALSDLFQQYGFRTHIDQSPDAYGVPVGLTVIGTKEHEISAVYHENPPSLTKDWESLTAQQLRQQAEAAFEYFHYDIAEKYLNYAVDNYGDPESLVLAGKQAFLLGDFERSKSILSPLIKDPAHNHQAAFWSAQSSFYQRRFIEASATLKAVSADMQSLPDDAEYLWLMGNSLYYAQEYQEALAVFEKIQAFDTAYPIQGIIKKNQAKIQQYCQTVSTKPLNIVLIGSHDPQMQLYWLKKAIEQLPGHHATAILERESPNNLPYDFYFSHSEDQPAILAALRDADFIHILNFPTWMDKNLQGLLQPQKCLIQYDATTSAQHWRQIKPLHEQSRVLALIDSNVSVPAPMPFPYFRNQTTTLTSDHRPGAPATLPEKHILLHITAQNEDIQRGTANICELGKKLETDGAIEQFICSRGDDYETSSKMLDQSTFFINSLRDDCWGFWAAEALHRGKPVFSALSAQGWMASNGSPIIATHTSTFYDQIQTLRADPAAYHSVRDQCIEWSKRNDPAAIARYWVSIYYQCRAGARFFEVSNFYSENTSRPNSQSIL